jgi:hypothetical protein
MLQIPRSANNKHFAQSFVDLGRPRESVAESDLSLACRIIHEVSTRKSLCVACRGVPDGAA